MAPREVAASKQETGAPGGLTLRGRFPNLAIGLTHAALLALLLIGLSASGDWLLGIDGDTVRLWSLAAMPIVGFFGLFYYTGTLRAGFAFAIFMLWLATGVSDQLETALGTDLVEAIQDQFGTVFIVYVGAEAAVQGVRIGKGETGSVGDAASKPS